MNERSRWRKSAHFAERKTPMRNMNEDLIKEVGAFVAERAFNNEAKPTVTEIQEKFRIARGTAYKYMKAAEKKGYCNRLDKYQRERFSSGMVVDASTSCGTPTYEEENVKEYVKLPGSMFGEDDKIITKANGDSMIEAGIDDGDVLIVSRQHEAKDGEIILALVDGATTLKTLMHHEDGRPYLHPENEAFDDIEIYEGTSFSIQGVLTYVLKNYRGFKSDVLMQGAKK